MMIPVDGHKNLYRDDETGAIVNCDQFEYNQYMLIKKQKKKERSEIENLKNEISEIKSMILQLMEKHTT